MSSPWKRTKLTSLYLDCLKKGHDLRLWKTGFGLFYVKCNTCGKVWRIHAHRLDYITKEEVPKVFGWE